MGGRRLSRWNCSCHVMKNCWAFCIEWLYSAAMPNLLHGTSLFEWSYKHLLKALTCLEAAWNPLCRIFSPHNAEIFILRRWDTSFWEVTLWYGAYLDRGPGASCLSSASNVHIWGTLLTKHWALHRVFPVLILSEVIVSILISRIKQPCYVDYRRMSWHCCGRVVVKSSYWGYIKGG